MVESDGAAGATAARDLLRHTVATLAYRGGKVLRDAPAGFAAVRPYPSSRTAGQILAHMNDLLDWALSLARGAEAWRTSAPEEFEAGVAGFFAALKALDDYLESDAALGTPPERIFQGPIADALTHVGQVAMLRRMAGSPVRGEDFQRADIAVGRVGRDQPPPRAEFR